MLLNFTLYFIVSAVRFSPLLDVCLLELCIKGARRSGAARPRQEQLCSAALSSDRALGCACAAVLKGNGVALM